MVFVSQCISGYGGELIKNCYSSSSTDIKITSIVCTIDALQLGASFFYNPVVKW